MIVLILEIVLVCLTVYIVPAAIYNLFLAARAGFAPKGTFQTRIHEQNWFKRYLTEK